MARYVIIVHPDIGADTVRELMGQEIEEGTIIHLKTDSDEYEELVMREGKLLANFFDTSILMEMAEQKHYLSLDNFRLIESPPDLARNKPEPWYLRHDKSVYRKGRR